MDLGALLILVVVPLVIVAAAVVGFLATGRNER